MLPLIVLTHFMQICSYILDGREFPIKSMLDYIFWKITDIIVGKQREEANWTGRLCPKIQKKLDKYVEWEKTAG